MSHSFLDDWMPGPSSINILVTLHVKDTTPPHRTPHASVPSQNPQKIPPTSDVINYEEIERLLYDEQQKQAAAQGKYALARKGFKFEQRGIGFELVSIASSFLCYVLDLDPNEETKTMVWG